MNRQKPIWTRTPKEISEDEYFNFYKSFSKDVSDPLIYTHFFGEGEIDFKSILYIPKTTPQGMFDQGKEKEHRGLRLYVKRVFITDDFSDMFPKYLSFVKGVVDSDNLPLNVSREILQQDRTLSLIKKKLVRKVITMLQNLSEDAEKYKEFWTLYGTNIKLGIVDDASNRSRISKLLRFHSSKVDSLTSFDDYISRAKEGQDKIYYLAGDSIDTLKTSPLTEQLVDNGYEILFMVDPIDEWTLSSLPKYDNKYQLVNVAKEDALPDEVKRDKKKEKENEKQFKELLDFLKEKLKGKIARVQISKQLVKTPSSIVSGSYGFTGNMERLMKAQAFSDQKQVNFMKSQRILEVNPNHPIIIELQRRVAENKLDPVAIDLADILYESASLNSGYTTEDPNAFATKIYRLMQRSLNLDDEPMPIPEGFTEDIKLPTPQQKEEL